MLLIFSNCTGLNSTCIKAAFDESVNDCFPLLGITLDSLSKASTSVSPKRCTASHSFNALQRVNVTRGLKKGLPVNLSGNL